MRQASALVVTLAFLTVALSGCFGGDDPAPDANMDDADEPAPDAVTTDDTGSVTGQVVDEALDPVDSATLAVSLDGEIKGTASADSSGRFTINDLGPGTYRLQATSLCCHPFATEVLVQAGEVSDVPVRLQTLSPDDLQTPYSVSDEWNGFLSCGVSAVVPGVVSSAFAACSATTGTPAEDPNEDFFETFTVSEGIRTLIVAMEWDSVGGLAGNELRLLVENEGCDLVSCSYEYAGLAGVSPLVVRIDDDDITHESFTWDNLTGERLLQFRVFTAGDANVVYQQPFSVYWHEFFWEEAPEDFNPIPEG